MRILLLALLPFSVMANDLVYDPSSTQTILTITCTYPTDREDGTPLLVSEIAKVNFYVDDGVSGYIDAGENTTACYQTYDLTKIPVGDYNYAVTATDTDGRMSLYSPVVVHLTVKKTLPPSAPGGVSGFIE